MGADKAYDTKAFIAGVRALNVTAHVQKNEKAAARTSMWAWSVRRSSMALHSLALVRTCRHSEKGRLVVTMTAAFGSLGDDLEQQFGGGLGQRHIAEFIDDDQLHARPSSTRRLLFPDAAKPTYFGQMTVRWMAPGPAIEGEGLFSGPLGRLCFFYLPQHLVYVPAVINQPEGTWLDGENCMRTTSACSTRSALPLWSN